MRLHIIPCAVSLLALCALSHLHAETIDQIAERERGNIDNESVQVYAGKVGKLPAIFFIEWAGKQVGGHYYHPARGKNKRYTLKGTNPRNGVLVLQEYSPQKDGTQKLTAKINMTKKVTDKKIIWQGTMHNIDGRKLAISFYRYR